jgi:hypothetical protein
VRANDRTKFIEVCDVIDYIDKAIADERTPPHSDPLKQSSRSDPFGDEQPGG